MVDFLVWIWLCVAVASALIEFVTMQMVSICFTFSSIVAIILARCGVVWWVQVIVFCVLALGLLLGLRKFSMKFLLKGSNEKTNAESIIGTTHTLLKPITKNEPGELKINGIVWTAVSNNGSSIKKDVEVKIEKIDGNKLVVSKITQKGE